MAGSPVDRQDSAGAVDRRCVRVKKDGERCRKWAVQGTTVCASHGAAQGSPVRATADRKVAEEKLRKRLGEYWDDAAGVTPSEAYQAALDVAAGNVRALRQVADEDEAGLSATQLEFMMRQAAEAARVAKMGIDAGVAERMVALSEQQAALLGGAFAESLIDGGVDAETARKVLELLGAKLQAAGL